MVLRRRNMVFVDLLTSAAASPPSNEWLFAAQCSPIFTLYTHGLHAWPEKIKATVSWTRIVPESGAQEPFPYRTLIDGMSIVTDEPRDGFGFGESVAASIDPTMLSLPPHSRGLAYLEWLHRTMLCLAHYRGWNEEPLRQARQYCIDHSFEARFESKTRHSPDRKHNATLRLFIDPDGLRELTITIRDRSGAKVTESRHEVRPFLVDFYIWRRLRNNLRWESATTVIADDAVGVEPYRMPAFFSIGATLD